MMIKKMVAPQPQSTIPPTPYSEQFATFFQEKWVGDAEADTGDTGRIAATKSKSVGYEMPSDHTTVVRLRTFSSPRPAPHAVAFWPGALSFRRPSEAPFSVASPNGVVGVSRRTRGWKPTSHRQRGRARNGERAGRSKCGYENKISEFGEWWIGVGRGDLG